MSKGHSKRRLFSLVNKEMHYWYVGLMVLTVFVISCIMGAFIFLSSSDTINLLKELAAGNPTLFESLQSLETNNMLRAFLALFLILIAIAVIGVIEMSKIAGPIYRMSKTAKKVADGDYSIPFKLRRNDIPQELGDSFGSVIDSLREKAKRDAGAFDEAASKLEEISAQIKHGKATPGLAKALDETISTLSGISREKKESTQPPL